MKRRLFAVAPLEDICKDGGITKMPPNVTLQGRGHLEKELLSGKLVECWRKTLRLWPITWHWQKAAN